MASSIGKCNNAVSRKFQKDALIHLQEMFTNQIEPDVVHMVFTESEYNMDAALETLFALASDGRTDMASQSFSKLGSSAAFNQDGNKSSETASRQPIMQAMNVDPRNLEVEYEMSASALSRSNFTGNVECKEPGARSFFGGNRVSTIYKSNEGLYTGDVPANAEVFGVDDHHQACFPNAITNGLGPKSMTSECSASDRDVAATTTRTFPVSSPSVISLDWALSMHLSKNASSGAVNVAGESWAKFCEMRENISPDSDKSIEADAMESVNWDLGRKATHLMQPIENEVGTERATAVSIQGKARWSKSEAKGSQPKLNCSPRPRRQLTLPYQSIQHLSLKEQLITRMENGERLLVLLRGCPGSGKTTLAHQIKFSGVILSADDYFFNNGRYDYDPFKLSDAHAFNRKLALKALQNRDTPIIIDNTNLEEWEMMPYVNMGLRFNYFIMFLEPDTPWRYNASQLASRNSHGVSYDKICQMLARFNRTITARQMVCQCMSSAVSTNGYNIANRVKQKENTGTNKPSYDPKLNNQRTRYLHPKPNTNYALSEFIKLEEPVSRNTSGINAPKNNTVSNYEDLCIDENALCRSQSAPDIKTEVASIPSTAELALPKAEPNEQETIRGRVDYQESKPLLSGDEHLYRLTLLLQSQNSTQSTLGGEEWRNSGTSNAQWETVKPEPERQLEQETVTDIKDLLQPDVGYVDGVESNSGSVTGTTTVESSPKPQRAPARSRRLPVALQNLNLKTDWEIPVYPGSKDHSFAVPHAISNPLTSSDDKIVNDQLKNDIGKPGSAAIKPEDDELKAVENSPTNENPLDALKTLFPTAPIDALRDIYDKCNGDLQWVVNLLLDSGYEKVGLLPTPTSLREDDLQHSIEGMAEVELEDVQADDDKVANAGDKNTTYSNCLHWEPPSGVAQQGMDSWMGPSEQMPQTSSSEPNFVLRLDPVLAMQLQGTFGPVGFHLSPASYFGSDLNVPISAEVARTIHDAWAKHIRDQLAAEEAELFKMTMGDEEYAKISQIEEDGRMASVLESDPLGPDYPPLHPSAAMPMHSFHQMPLTDKKENMASRIKRRQLYEMYPKIDRKALDEVFNANGASFADTVQAIDLSFCPDQKPKLVIAPEQLEEYENALISLAEQESFMLERERIRRSQDLERVLDDPSYDDLRAEATLHYHLRKECFAKARDAFEKGWAQAASFYSQQGHLHARKLHEANKRASQRIFEIQNAKRNPNTLDLHKLHVHEAMKALTEFMEEKKQALKRSSANQLTLNIITGKGSHSLNGVPKIKPAVLEHLIKQKYSFYEPNPGQLEVTLSKQKLNI